MHSNFTIDGSKTVQNGMLPTNHAEHETIEITHGVTDWFEVGFYIFTSERNGFGVQWVGDHIRPRVRIPPEVEMAGGFEPIERTRISAGKVFGGHLDMGDAADYR